MMRKLGSVVWLIVFFLSIQGVAFAVNEIQISGVFVDSQSTDRYSVGATLLNQTDKPREVTVRAQVFFFEQASPKNDKPAMILRKDMTVILKKKERRKIRVRLINEGSFPKERLRVEPEVRLRRQRIWNY